jgi:hypothetical protein
LFILAGLFVGFLLGHAARGDDLRRHDPRRQAMLRMTQRDIF